MNTTIHTPLAVVCGARPKKELILTEEQLGMTADQLAQMLGAATRTANYHTRPPPAEDRSHDKKYSASNDKFKLSCLAPSSLSTSSSSSAAASLVKASGLVSSIHLGVFFRAFMQNNVMITGEVLEQLIAMCVSNEPEWVHKVQQTALAFIFDLMESKGDSAVLQRYVGSLVHIPTVASPSTSSASTSSGSHVSVDDIAFLAQLRNHSTIINAHASNCPDIVVSCTQFRFIIDANSLGSDGSVDFSAQVRITNTGKCPVNVRVAQEITIVDGHVVPTEGSTSGAMGDGVGGSAAASASSSISTAPSSAYTSPAKGGVNTSSSALSGDAMSPAAINAINNSKHTDSQILLERAFLKKGESSRLLLSFVAKSNAAFNTYTKVLVLMVHESIKVVVSFVVVNPMQPLFGTPFPSCIPQPVVESPLGSYEAPLILQVIKHHFQVMGGFGWREVGAMLSTNGVNPLSRYKSVVHDGAAANSLSEDPANASTSSSSGGGGGNGSHANNTATMPLNEKVLLDAIALRNRLCDDWPCGALLPKLWQHGPNGSILTPSVFGVTAPPSGVAPGPMNASAATFSSATSSTLKTRVTVPVSSSCPIGYTAGAVRPSGGSAGAVYNTTKSAGSVTPSSQHNLTAAVTSPAMGPVVGGSSPSQLALGGNNTTDSMVLTPTSATIPTPTAAAAPSDIPSMSQQQVLINAALRLEPLVNAQPQTLFALVLLWFAEFPTPILDRSLTMCDPCVFLNTMQPHLQHLMAWLIDFCCCFLVHGEANGATIRNLALTFAPLLMDHVRCVPSPARSEAAAAASFIKGSGVKDLLGRGEGVGSMIAPPSASQSASTPVTATLLPSVAGGNHHAHSRTTSLSLNVPTAATPPRDSCFSAAAAGGGGGNSPTPNASPKRAVDGERSAFPSSRLVSTECLGGDDEESGAATGGNVGVVVGVGRGRDGSGADGGAVRRLDPNAHLNATMSCSVSGGAFGGADFDASVTAAMANTDADTVGTDAAAASPSSPNEEAAVRVADAPASTSARPNHGSNSSCSTVAYMGRSADGDEGGEASGAGGAPTMGDIITSEGHGDKFSGHTTHASKGAPALFGAAAVPRDALVNDITLQLHCTTALVHWLKKYQHFYSKASSTAAAAAASAAAAAAAVASAQSPQQHSSGTPSRPLSPIAGAANPSAGSF